MDEIFIELETLRKEIKVLADGSAEHITDVVRAELTLKRDRQEALLRMLPLDKMINYIGFFLNR